MVIETLFYVASLLALGQERHHSQLCEDAVVKLCGHAAFYADRFMTRRKCVKAKAHDTSVSESVSSLLSLTLSKDASQDSSELFIRWVILT
jgi:hypothetical protein